MASERTLERTLLYHNDVDISDAGHCETWVARHEHLPEATIAMAVRVAPNDIVQLRRLCRLQKRRPSEIAAHALSEYLERWRLTEVGKGSRDGSTE